MRSLSLKFTLTLIITSLLVVVFVAFSASQITKQEFARYLGQSDERAITEIFTELYEEYGNWEDIPNANIRNILSSQNIAYRNYAVADPSGVIVIGNAKNPVGSKVNKLSLNRGTSIKVDGETIGKIISDLPLAPRFSSAIQDFSDQINHSLVISGLIAVGISVILGTIFSRTLTRQLERLSKATQSVAKGESTEQIPVRSKDEVGQLTEAFNQMNAELAHSNHLRKQMTADIAHELRTPLSIILGRAETLAEGYLPPTQEVFDVMHQEALRINRLVEDLRTLSLSDAGELNLERKPTSILKLLTDTRTAHLARSEELNIHLNVECEPGLPSILVDPDRIRQVLDNLVSNALRYISPDGEVCLSARQKAAQIIVQVTDTGRGIPQEDIPYLFDRLYRGDKSRNREKGGSGLGLAIAKSLINAHGGEIQVTSLLEIGSTFTISLPISPTV